MLMATAAHLPAANHQAATNLRAALPHQTTQNQPAPTKKPAAAANRHSLTP